MNRESLYHNKPVLLQILPSLNSGGVERGTVDIAIAAAKAGFISIVASSGGRLVSRLEHNNVIHIKLPLMSKNIFRMWLNKRAIEKIIQEYSVNIVHARSRAPAWSAYYAAKNNNVPFITTFHGTHKIQNNTKKKYNSIMTKGDTVIAVSEYIADHIKTNYNVDPRKVKIIHRGVDLDVFTRDKVTTTRILNFCQGMNLPDDLPIILLPGRITSWKGHVYLLRALELLSHSNFFVVFVGQYDEQSKYFKKLKDYIRKSIIADKVAIYSHIDDMPTLYSLATIVISASTEPEAFGRIAIEAQAMGKLCIATKHGGSQETIIHDQTGWLVDIDNPQDFADKIDYCLNISESEAERIINNAKEHIRNNFSLNKMIEETLDIYYQHLPAALLPGSKSKANYDDETEEGLCY